MKVPSQQNNEELRHQSLAHAFKCAGEGVSYAIHERNMRIHICFAVLAIILGFVARLDAASWLAVVLCICIVFSLEVINTALEAIVDLVSPEYHPLAKVAKDCAAGAVLICAVGSLVVAAIVYLPPLFSLFA